MHIGELILAPPSGTRVYVTPWLPRQADNAYVTYELFNLIGSPTVTVAVYHKDRDEQGSALDAGHKLSGTFSAVTGTNFWTQKFSGLRELLRFQITVQANSAALEGAYYRFLQPTWFDTIR
jgi:hypothetical protein